MQKGDAGRVRYGEGMGGSKLWELRPVEELEEGDNPWEPWYDKSVGFIVEAETEKEARHIANENAGDENRTETPWLDGKYSTCEELKPHGGPRLIMRDFTAA